MNPLARFLVVLAVAGGAAGAVFATGGFDRTAEPSPAPTAAAAFERCALPDRKPAPEWFPQDLPMPDTSYVADVPEASAGIRRAVYVAPGTLDDFVKHVVERWPEAGWKLGAGEREAFEAESTFIKGEDRYGQFRAIAACPAWVAVHLVLSDPAASGA